MRSLVASVFVLILAGSALADPSATQPAGKPNDKRELLAENNTVAKFTGIAYQQCRGMTALCPDQCGGSGDFASFQIVSYLVYRKPGQYGDPKTTTYTFQVEDNMKNLKVPKELAAEVRGLKPGDYVLLNWRHDYVTRFEEGGRFAQFPERPITMLRKISKDEAAQLMNPNAAGPTTQPASQPDAFQIQCKKPEDRVAASVEEGSTTFTVTSPSGIGQATIERKGDAWPKTVVLRLNLKGLESLVISNGKTELSASVGGEGVRLSADGRPLAGKSSGPGAMDPLWMSIQSFNAAGDAGHYFGMTLPKAMLGEKAKVLTIQWIDYYRN